MRRPIRLRFYDISPLEPATSEAESYTLHDDFLPNGRTPHPRGTKVRTVLFHFTPLPDENVELERYPDGSVDVVLHSDTTDYPGSIPPGADGTRDHVHHLHFTDGDPLLKKMNRDHAIFYSEHAVRGGVNTYQAGSEPARLRAINEINRRHYEGR